MSPFTNFASSCNACNINITKIQHSNICNNFEVCYIIHSSIIINVTLYKILFLTLGSLGPLGAAPFNTSGVGPLDVVLVLGYWPAALLAPSPDAASLDTAPLPDPCGVLRVSDEASRNLLRAPSAPAMFSMDASLAPLGPAVSCNVEKKSMPVTSCVFLLPFSTIGSV